MSLTTEELVKLDRQMLKADFPFTATELNEWLLEQGHQIEKIPEGGGHHAITPSVLKAIREQVYGIYDVIEVDALDDD
jgi:hypothetical protein